MNNKLRPKALYPTYPPYHKGDYLEEFFYKYYKNESERKYIDIFWTNIYCNRDYTGLNEVNVQNEIDELDKNEKYFTVCQHDDGPKENLPEDTLIFSAGGRRKHGNIIPIPLICSKIPEELKTFDGEKNIFASFVGSLTHPIREKMYRELVNKNGYSINMCQWSNTVPLNNLKFFVDISLRSKYILCPRGYGPTSFRLYEAFQLNAVPVYISDDHYLPWTDEIDWNEFCILIKESDVKNIDNILKSISEQKYNEMLENIKNVYDTFFTMSGIFNNIKKRLI